MQIAVRLSKRNVSDEEKKIAIEIIFVTAFTPRDYSKPCDREWWSEARQ